MYFIAQQARKKAVVSQFMVGLEPPGHIGLGEVYVVLQVEEVANAWIFLEELSGLAEVAPGEQIGVA